MEPQKSSIGSIIGTIIIIAIIILGGLYFWGKRMAESNATQNLVNEPQTSTTTDNSEASVIKSTSQSDELDSINTDLQMTNTDNLNTEATAQAQ